MGAQGLQGCLWGNPGCALLPALVPCRRLYYADRVASPGWRPNRKPQLSDGVSSPATQLGVACGGSSLSRAELVIARRRSIPATCGPLSSAGSDTKYGPQTDKRRALNPCACEPAPTQPACGQTRGPGKCVGEAEGCYPRKDSVEGEKQAESGCESRDRSGGTVITWRAARGAGSGSAGRLLQGSCPALWIHQAHLG